MTPEQETELFARLDDIAGMHIGLTNTLAAVFTLLPADAKAQLKAHLPKMDDAMAAAALNSGFQDRSIEVADRVYRQLTGLLR
jgi:hypothetical protein